MLHLEDLLALTCRIDKRVAQIACKNSIAELLYLENEPKRKALWLVFFSKKTSKQYSMVLLASKIPSPRNYERVRRGCPANASLVIGMCATKGYFLLFIVSPVARTVLSLSLPLSCNVKGLAFLALRIY